MKTLPFLFALLLSLVACTHAPPTVEFCHAHLAIDTHCKLAVEQVTPTQPSVGLQAVWERTEKIEKKYRKNKLATYLKEKVAPVVIGPGQKYYILDRHHLSLALYLAKIPHEQKLLHARVLANFSQMDQQQFWNELKKRNWVYLKRRGVDINVSELPQKVTELRDDPYRSLARLAEKKGLFQKEDRPYIQFEWAQQLRDKIKIPDDQMPKTKAELKALLKDL